MTEVFAVRLGFPKVSLGRLEADAQAVMDLHVELLQPLGQMRNCLAAPAEAAEGVRPE